VTHSILVRVPLPAFYHQEPWTVVRESPASRPPCSARLPNILRPFQYAYFKLY